MAAHGRRLSAPPLPDDLQQALDLFRSQFAEQLPARLAEADTALAAWRAAPGDDEALRSLFRVLHRLAGSAGTFGMPLFGDACRVIELQLEELLARGDRTVADVERIAQAIAQLDALPRA